ncbi:serine hydrolase domain-containing protein [Qipengyuania seohaensis]|uniref:serine hydrolase domain-containing protein n=1 Tax=Qipengyuania seohaensis TaxID=266951 RepID=UPI000C22B783|nr:serine hydrolase [Qipengyuania seohaensis]
MIRYALAASALLVTTPLAAQSTAQEVIDARYSRALAAGYKALFLCSAIANAEWSGAQRSPESVHQWELTGVDARYDGIIRDLPYEILRDGADGSGAVNRVDVSWAQDAPPRSAKHFPGSGCVIMPIGMDPAGGEYTPNNVSSDGSLTFALPAPPAFSVPAPPSSATNAVLAAALDETYGEGTRTTAVLVTKDRKPVDWATGPDFTLFTPQRTWSVAKSIAATIVGAAVQRGEISVEGTASLAGMSNFDPRREITIDHALRMASGRYSDTPGNRTEPLYWGGTTVDERAQNWPLIYKPGTVYRYANNDTLAAVAAISETFEAHPPREVLKSIGMSDTIPEYDWRGNYVLSSQVWAHAHDLSKLGELYLNDGVGPDGTRILPEGWVEYVSSPSGPQPGGPFGYGAGFWLLNNSDGVPTDTFAAMGNRGQYVVIVPSLNVVIVRRGEDPSGSRFDIAAFTRDVLESLEK